MPADALFRRPPDRTTRDGGPGDDVHVRRLRGKDALGEDFNGASGDARRFGMLHNANLGDRLRRKSHFNLHGTAPRATRSLADAGIKNSSRGRRASRQKPCRKKDRLHEDAFSSANLSPFSTFSDLDESVLASAFAGAFNTVSGAALSLFFTLPSFVSFVTST